MEILHPRIALVQEYRKIGVTLNVTNVTFAVTRINPSLVRFTFSLQ